jgi:hypothetical protein
MPKVYLLLPYRHRTGGPEAIFQLSDALLSQGFDVDCVYFDKTQVRAIRKAIRAKQFVPGSSLDFTLRTDRFPEYEVYKAKFGSVIPDSPYSVVVIPEMIADFASIFSHAKVLVWWLSVDFGFHSLSKHNVNYLRKPNVFHAVQSEYARHFAELMSFSPIFTLTDYTALSFVSRKEVEKNPNLVALSALDKVVVDLNKLEALLRKEKPDIEIVRIQGMTREQVLDTLAKSTILVDLGNLPGKDRLPREAAVLGNAVVISRVGAGANVVDFGIPSADRINPWDLEAVAKRVIQLLNSPEEREENIRPLRAKVAGEKEDFHAEAGIALRKIAEICRIECEGSASGPMIPFKPKFVWEGIFKKP